MKCSLIAAVIGMLLAGCDAGHPKSSQALNDFSALTNALDMYRLNGGHYPTTEQGLAALVSRPTTGPLPRMWIQLIQQVPLDPWGQLYHYRWKSGTKVDTETFVLWSAGQDGQDGTADDLQSEFSSDQPLTPTDR